MGPWWYEYVKDALVELERGDIQEARALLEEIVIYGKEAE